MNALEEKPKIVPLPNGPYYLLNDFQKKVIRHLQDSNGQDISTVQDVDAENAKKVMQTVKKCPSGALSYSIDGMEYKDQDRSPKVVVSENGPLQVVGGIELVGVTWPDKAAKEHCTLCRCGQSDNKPFCDGTHNIINFKD